jgi:hypothetical protein
MNFSGACPHHSLEYKKKLISKGGEAEKPLQK